MSNHSSRKDTTTVSGKMTGSMEKVNFSLKKALTIKDASLWDRQL